MSVAAVLQIHALGCALSLPGRCLWPFRSQERRCLSPRFVLVSEGFIDQSPFSAPLSLPQANQSLKTRTWRSGRKPPPTTPAGLRRSCSLFPDLQIISPIRRTLEIVAKLPPALGTCKNANRQKHYRSRQPRTLPRDAHSGAVNLAGGASHGRGVQIGRTS